jgi:hypothetical protein
MLILGRAEAEVAGIGSVVVEPTVVFVSEVEVMQHIFAEATDSSRSGTLTTIEPMTTRAARIATRPDLARHRWAPA